MTKEKYTEVIAMMAATLLAGRLKTPEYGSISEVAVRNAGEILVEAVKLADREFGTETTTPTPASQEIARQLAQSEPERIQTK